MTHVCLFFSANSMYNIQFCRNIAYRQLVSPLLNSRTALPNHLKQIKSVSSSVLPDKSSENGHRRKNQFKNDPSDTPHKYRDDPRNVTLESSESEKEFLVRLKNDPDVFGDTVAQPEIVDEGDILEEKYFAEQPDPQRRLRTKQYADIIKKYIRQRRIKEAIDVLEIRMLKEDRVKPENYIYNLLLGACGRVGYTKKAFMLYNDMKKRSLKVTGGTYTALFNACANSPWPLTDGITRAKHLHDIMIEKGDQPNDTTYNAMIKAFGRCGDLPMSFLLVDEMAQKGFAIKDDTINFLLQACISDKETGFRHSLLVWRKLVEKKIDPSIYTFNLLLRCVRDCELGDLDTTKDIVNRLLGNEIRFTALGEPEYLDTAKISIRNNTSNHEEIKLLAETSEVQSTDPESQRDEDSKELTLSSTIPKPSLLETKSLDMRPNLLAEKPHLGSILSLSEVKKPEDRLLLLGGCKGFLQTMSHYKCTPDIKTFTQLLDVIPSTLAAEKELLASMRKLNVSPDIDFYNMLIKKKSLRLDYQGAKEVLTSMKQMKLRPDLITYGVLSLGCQTKEEAADLVMEMKSHGYMLNAAILGAMLKQACYHMLFDYIFEIMELCLKESIPVNKKFLEHLDTFKEKTKAKLNAKQLNKKEVKMFGIFKARHKTWLTEVQIDESEDTHPWQQYRQKLPDDPKFKPKDSARFKPRHSSLFKVKTSTKVRNNDRWS